MKKIILPVIIVVAVAALVLVLGPKPHVGTWECSSYEMYNQGQNQWQSQPDVFMEQFSMNIYKDGKIIVKAFGNSNEGQYTLNKDTLEVEMMNYTSRYLLDKDVLNLLGHPRAKIEYTKVSRKIEE